METLSRGVGPVLIEVGKLGATARHAAASGRGFYYGGPWREAVLEGFFSWS